MVRRVPWVRIKITKILFGNCNQARLKFFGFPELGAKRIRFEFIVATEGVHQEADHVTYWRVDVLEENKSNDKRHRIEPKALIKLSRVHELPKEKKRSRATAFER